MYLCSGPILVEPSINNCRVKGAPEVKLFCNLNRVTGLNHSKLVLRLNVNDFIAESWKVKGFVVEDCKRTFSHFSYDNYLSATLYCNHILLYYFVWSSDSEMCRSISLFVLEWMREKNNKQPYWARLLLLELFWLLVI